MFESILIANRGEIAVRIIRAAHELGIRAIAVYSDADQGALWTRLADEAHRLEPATVRTPYLNARRIIAIARACRASAIHPGYGLLSENAAFAQAVLQADIAWIGPRPDTIALMGDKVAAREVAVACGLPLVPGSPHRVDSLAQASALADELGWPVIVKASFGGGGRGMRVAMDRTDLAAALEQSAREASAAFGRAEVYLERYLQRTRHVEVQILGDTLGHQVHLGDRDCSVQRRHQKLIEEAPAPNVPEALRSSMFGAASALCRHLAYEGAGTVEFLVDMAAGEFFFLEMNTRLQVEHGVSELVTGIDLLHQQIRIAAGEPLDVTQAEARLAGHAMQARIAAEDAWAGFKPVAGRIERLSLPLGPWLRLDFGVEAGDRIPHEYDSMFGKIQAWGRTREEARRRLATALDALVVEGVPTTAPYLRGLLEQPAFVAAVHDTGALERDWQADPAMKPKPSARPPSQDALRSHGAARSRSERRVRIPWGDRVVEVAVFGAASATEAGTAEAGRTARERDGGSDAQAVAETGAVVAPMDALVLSVGAAVGAAVVKGAALLVLEAMKMQVIVAAPRAGTVERLLVEPGDTVRAGAELARLA